MAALLAGCDASPDPATDGVIRIVASTDVYGDLAASVGGEGVEVTSIIADPAQDPHGFEASPRVQLALAGADIVISNGGGYDDFVRTMLDASGNTSAIAIQAVTESGYSVSDGFNEHLWFDYPTVSAVVSRIAEALATIDPDSAETYSSNAAAIQTGLDDLAGTAESIAREASGAGVIITEPIPGYLLLACGLVILTPSEFSAAIEEDTDVPPALLQQVLTLVEDGSAALVVFNEQTGGPQTDAVLNAARAAGVPIVGVTETLPAGSDYLGWQAELLGEISAALGIDLDS